MRSPQPMAHRPGIRFGGQSPLWRFYSWMFSQAIAFICRDEELASS